MRERRQCFLKWFCSRQSWPCLDLSDLWYFEPEHWCLAFADKLFLTLFLLMKLAQMSRCVCTTGLNWNKFNSWWIKSNEILSTFVSKWRSKWRQDIITFSLSKCNGNWSESIYVGVARALSKKLLVLLTVDCFLCFVKSYLFFLTKSVDQNGAVK